MSQYGNYSSDEGSNDEIGFPKTPGQPLVAHHSDENNSNNESNKSSSEANISDSEQSENEGDVKRKSDSEEENDKKSSSGELDSEVENKSSESHSDSDSDNESKRKSTKEKKRRVTSDNENSNHKGSDSSSDGEDVNRPQKKISSDSDSDAGEVAPESRKRKQAVVLASSDESDQEDGKNDTTAKDLFGDLSDEDDENKSGNEQRSDNRKKARIEEDDDEENDSQNATNDSAEKTFGAFAVDEEDNEFNNVAVDRGVDSLDMGDEEEEEPVRENRIDTEVPFILAKELGDDFHFVKLPNFLSVHTHPYDPQTYEDEIDLDTVHDDEGRARLKLKVENTIRWRKVLGEDGNEINESNARVVKWSDGSMSLHLGDEIFDIQTLKLLSGEHNHLFIRQGTGLQGQSLFHTKLTFRPFSTESFTHRKLTLSLADRSQKTQKICVLPSVGKDPDANRSVMIKKEEDKLKASIRKESNTRRVKDRAYTRGTNSGYLENDDEDDESISISKIKNQYKNAPAFSGANYSSADSDEPSDEDSEEDIFEKKKSTEKRKIVESDEDED